MKGIYKISIKILKGAYIELITIVDTKYMNKLVSMGLEIYFGTMFDKYIEFSTTISEVQLLSTNDDDIKVVKRLGIESSIDVFKMSVVNFDYDLYDIEHDYR